MVDSPAIEGKASLIYGKPSRDGSDITPAMLYPPVN